MNGTPTGSAHNGALLEASARTEDLFQLTQRWQDGAGPVPPGGFATLRKALEGATPALPVPAFAAVRDEYQRLQALGARVFQDAERVPAHEAPRAPAGDCAGLQDGRELCERYRDLQQLHHATGLCSVQSGVRHEDRGHLPGFQRVVGGLQRLPALAW